MTEQDIKKYGLNSHLKSDEIDDVSFITCLSRYIPRFLDFLLYQYVDSKMNTDILTLNDPVLLELISLLHLKLDVLKTRSLYQMYYDIDLAIKANHTRINEYYQFAD
jgi:hypothetical protein